MYAELLVLAGHKQDKPDDRERQQHDNGELTFTCSQ